MAYVTLATFKNYLENQRTGTANDARLQAALDAAHRGIDDYLGRPMVVADTPSARLYAPDGDELLTIHDCTTVTVVTENGATLTAGTDYQAEPLNNLTDSGQTWPYYTLRRLNSVGWFCTASNYGAATVSVTGTWGWVAIPHPVVEACKMLAKDIAGARELKGDVGGFNEFGAVRIRQNKLIADLLKDYRKTKLWDVL